MGERQKTAKIDIFIHCRARDDYLAEWKKQIEETGETKNVLCNGTGNAGVHCLFSEEKPCVFAHRVYLNKTELLS